MMGNADRTINVNGGQYIEVNDSATANVTQNNGVTANELDSIIKTIKANLGGLEKENAEAITNAVEMAGEELMRPEPRAGRLKNCVTLISPMFTIANGIPVLLNNLQKLVDYITRFI